MGKLFEKRCIPCEGGISPLNSEQISSMLGRLTGWKLDSKKIAKIYKIFRFENFHQTIAFVNAIAWVAHIDNHHPSLEIKYNSCTVKYWTHAINGLSENDFICASRVEQLLLFDNQNS